MTKGDVRIYDRMDKDIPHGSDIYIVDTHDNYAVFRNIYGLTFCEYFKEKKDAINYYNDKVAHI